MQHIFWNRQEKRLTGVWRVAIFQVAFWLSFSWMGDHATPLLRRLRATGEFGKVLEPVAGKFLALGLTFLALWLAARYLDHRRFADYGFHFNKRWWKLFGGGVGVALVFQALQIGAGMLAGHMRVVEVFHPASPAVPVWFGLLVALPHMVIIGLWEEAATRGHPVRNLAEACDGFGPRLAPLAGIMMLSFSGVVFGLAHLFNGVHEFHRLAFLCGFGMALAAIYSVHGELAFPIGYHAATDLAVFHLFSPNKGDASVFLIEKIKPDAGMDALIFLAFVMGVFLWLAARTSQKGYRSPLADYQSPQGNPS